MAINMATAAYLPNYNTWARPITVTPLKSQPTASPYVARGIYDTAPLDVTSEDGTIVSDSRVILDVLEMEFTVVPRQGDHISIPSDVGMPPRGDFEVIDADTNGFETTLTLRKLVVPKP